MIEFHDIITPLRDDDGSCRDVNFEHPTWEGVRNLIPVLVDSFATYEARDQDGREIPGLGPNSVSTFEPGAKSIFVVFREGAGLFRRLQLFVSSDDNDTPFIEFTFFPEDLVPTPALRERFIAEGFRVVLNSPFSGGNFIRAHAKPRTGDALQLELRYATYLDCTNIDQPGRPTLDPSRIASIQAKLRPAG